MLVMEYYSFKIMMSLIFFLSFFSISTLSASQPNKFSIIPDLLDRVDRNGNLEIREVNLNPHPPIPNHTQHHLLHPNLNNQNAPPQMSPYALHLGLPGQDCPLQARNRLNAGYAAAHHQQNQPPIAYQPPSPNQFYYVTVHNDGLEQIQPLPVQAVAEQSRRRNSNAVPVANRHAPDVIDLEGSEYDTDCSTDGSNENI